MFWDSLHSDRQLWVHKTFTVSYRNDETFTDSFANYTNAMLPGVILLPQLNLNIFLNPF